MGIKDLWKIVSSSRQETSFTELSWNHFENTGRPLIIGVDSSLWFCQIQAALSARGLHAQLGSNPELAAVFYKLSFFLSLPIVLVFVFDGPLRPGLKRSKRVGAAAHWMTQPFKELVLTFGYHVHKAPGEAEAELAHMNAAGLIDAVLTDDSDALLFGARLIIRSPHIKRDPDSVATYHANDIAQDANTPLMHGGMILFAVLRGGDYSKGLNKCGSRTAYGLTHTELGTELLLAVDENQETLSTFLPSWRRKLRHHLANDPYGFIGRKNKKLATNIPKNFPSMDVVKMYAKPLISDWTNLPTTSWNDMALPDLHGLSALTEHLFRWRSAGSMEQKFSSKVFSPFSVKYLTMLLSTPNLTVKYGAEVFQILDVTNVKTASDRTMFNIRFNTNVLACLSSYAPGVDAPIIQVWIPSCIIAAIPALFRNYCNHLQSSKKTPSVWRKLALVNSISDERSGDNLEAVSGVIDDPHSEDMIDLTDSDSDDTIIDLTIDSDVTVIDLTVDM
ncbi:PIN domain-like protein [Dendrothele bispora CBS 962.96]|uniref:PIN domain-like protein n=1 Tax=Dendrothele bispora (strain CBS 962.96) TaxID=1314807 RepID=A0A4S8LWI0_DENBC|nr:PIN domain-like protein [Dendrothele bispora CBS 962.96]